METFLGLMIGIGLSAACGFRVFVPLLGVSIASMSGYLTLTPSFAWLGSWPAFIAFATATIIEIVAYYVPWLDHLLDTFATPAAVVAGSIVTASLVGSLNPFLKWSLAIIAGGGTAGVIQAGTVLLRGASSAGTGGYGNFLVATLEAIGSVLTTFLAIVIPIVCLLLVAFLLILGVRKLVRGKQVARIP
jgi:hypothetical protein